MSKFTKVSGLDEYQFTLVSESSPEQNRQVVVIAESAEAATEQAAKFAEHLSADSGTKFEVSEAKKLENFHVTYTEQAWAALKASE